MCTAARCSSFSMRRPASSMSSRWNCSATTASRAAATSASGRLSWSMPGSMRSRWSPGRRAVMADGSYRPTRWERQRYWHGQLLRSTDLGDQLVQEAQLRWWHNRAIHNAYGVVAGLVVEEFTPPPYEWLDVRPDRKSTRLNSSHVKISYAVFCLKK